ncbi:hypothetical protein BB559_002922 [Furculomyces boomerangus]|uniref:CobW/HypB/UreG nucleotide-binding domain-containing protein n=1 Tax=Furculomyces boomerangus TaxID=61424 RepID=A0A2T9YR79_9FUNG|nr:hypothetical protein BB559_002922 [Furculomyces boomerangus]
MKVPITVFTGFLGSGKTTLILEIAKNLPKDYNVVILKNEFGNAETDSILAKENNLQVTEMINGCLCCVLVGQMKNALLEIQTPIAWQIREMNDLGFVLDSIMTVIDCANFMGYEDTSYTAKLQAQYTDLILLNKVELVTERQLDLVIDRVNELNTDTPKVKVYKDSPIGLDLVFGIDTQLFKVQPELSHNSDTTHSENEIDVIQFNIFNDNQPTENNFYTENNLNNLLSKLPSEDVYRVKGIILLYDTLPNSQDSELNTNIPKLHILNFAYGRFTLTPLTNQQSLEDLKSCVAKITVMGSELKMYQQRLSDFFKPTNSQITTHWAKRTFPN